MDDLDQAIAAGDETEVARLLGANPGAVNQRAPTGVSKVLWASYHGRAVVVDALMAAGPDLDVFDSAALGRDRELDILLGLDPALARARSADGFTALHLAAYFDRPGAAALLLAAGADLDAETPDDRRLHPLHSAAAGRSAAVARLLLAAGAHPDVRQPGGFTPLHAAAEHGDEALVTLLVDRGADPALCDDEGRDAAAFARAEGHADLARRLELTRP